MKRLSSKIFAGYFLVIFLLTGLILFFTYRNVSHQHVVTITDNLNKINTILENKIVHFIENEQFSELDKYVKKTGKEINIRLTIVDSTGRVLADSEGDPAKMENHRNRPELEPIYKGERIGKAERFSSTVHKEMLYVAHALFGSSGQFIGAIRTSIFRNQAKELINQMILQILQIASVVVLITLIGALIFVRSLTKPINQISEASRKVAGGNFDIKVNISGRDEINELATNFNNMTAQIKTLFAEVTKQKEELNTIIKAIQDGLVAFDITGKVLVANASFCKIVSNSDVLDKNINEITQNQDILSLFQQTLNEKSGTIKEISNEKKFYLCSSSFIEAKKEVVLLFHDITEIKKLEQLKKDFVANVSHELRTPLTAIKGFIETLEDEIDAQYHHYIDIIKRNTNRLISIVQDLLMLSELEAPNTQLIKSFVDARIIIDNVLKIFEPKLKDKGLNIDVHYQDNFPKINVDVFRMEQVFINFIDNAIKYSDSGTILISCSYDDRFAYFAVKDNGMGISKEDAERIFERFYIADKSRSKKTGGTGLGLSIVKHIVLLHNGEIAVESEKGIGTTFKFKIPIS